MMQTDELHSKALELRRTVLEMCYRNGGHIAACYSSVEILQALYYTGVMRFDAGKPEWDGRDRLILSKGHGQAILYAVLADLGYFPSSWLLEHFKKGDFLLGGHVDSKIPGVELTTGALGHGLGYGCGLALAARLNGEDSRTFVVMGDAECSEGSVWEGALFAAQQELANLTAIVDSNKIGSLDFTENYIAYEPFADKWEAFGWDVVTVKDGHDVEALRQALESNRGEARGKPRLVIADTVKGKGVSVFENDPIWHVKKVDETDYATALKELGVSNV